MLRKSAENAFSTIESDIQTAAETARGKTAAQLKLLEHRLQALIDPAVDSLRFYTLGNRTPKNVVHIGAKPSADMEGSLIL